MSFHQILLQAATTPAAGGGGLFGSQGMSSFLMIGLVVVVFYFFMMRPQMKKQKEQTNFLSEIGKGTKIVTIGGICGKVLEVRAKSFLIEVEGGNRLQILKSAISLENSKIFNAETDDLISDKKD
ncbi:MAG: preprotein translocase subunit YajC [Bacteroidetes bacterium]|nr:preprotein translocase subunit YajC [Bacteroidota bacterium]